MKEESSRKLFYTVSILLLWAGNLFLGVGQFHPPTGMIDLDVTAVGEYWMAFALLSTEDPWLFIHGAILAGPLLMALGMVGVYRFMQEKGENNFSLLALIAILMGALLWAMAFVLDGFATEAVGRYLNEGIIDPNVGVMSVRLLQVIVLRSSLASIVLIGGCMVFLSTSVWVTSIFSRRIRIGLCVVGFIFGVWPIIAMVSGIFVPGPFVSALWPTTITVINLWFFVIGLMVMKSVRASETTSPETIGHKMNLAEGK